MESTAFVHPYKHHFVYNLEDAILRISLFSNVVTELCLIDLHLKTLLRTYGQSTSGYHPL